MPEPTVPGEGRDAPVMIPPGEERAMPALTLSEGERTRIAEALTAHGALGACPSCHENEWLIGDGYSLVVMRANLQGWTEDGPSLATVSRICSHCGYLSLHAARVLGIEAPGVE